MGNLTNKITRGTLALILAFSLTFLTSCKRNQEKKEIYTKGNECNAIRILETLERDYRENGAYLNTPLEELASAKKVDYEPLDKKGFQNSNYLGHLRTNLEAKRHFFANIYGDGRKIIWVSDYNSDKIKDIEYILTGEEGVREIVKYGRTDGTFSVAEKLKPSFINYDD